MDVLPFLMQGLRPYHQEYLYKLVLLPLSNVLTIVSWPESIDALYWSVTMFSFRLNFSSSRATNPIVSEYSHNTGKNLLRCFFDCPVVGNE